MTHEQLVEEMKQDKTAIALYRYISEAYPNGKVQDLVDALITTTAQRVREETIKEYLPYIEHRIECIKQFEEDAECDCGLSTLNKFEMGK